MPEAKGKAQGEESPFLRDTVPPSPNKARLIENEISGEFDLSKLRAEVPGDAESPSIPPPPQVPLERIQEGVQYRLVPTGVRASSIPFEPDPASLRPTPAAPPPSPRGRAPQAAWEAAIEVRERKLKVLEQELRDREERLLEREMVIGGRERVLAEREEKLKQREVRLRDWEARLMDMQAEIRESYPPKKTEQDEAPRSVQAPDPVTGPIEPRSSSFKIEITSGGGGWEMLDEEPGDGR